MQIEKMLIRYNKTVAKGRKIKYIVIHDTGNKGKGAGVDSHFNFFNGGDRQSSADFFVDDKKIGQFTDYKNEYSWHAGKKYGEPPVKDCTNANSVGIEICINVDGNYAKAVSNTIELVKHLQKELNIPDERVIRHYDACLKQCPGSMAANNWQAWKEFKQKLSAPPAEKKDKTSLIVDEAGKIYTIQVEAVNIDGRNHIQLRDLAQIPSIQIDYDEAKKMPIIRVGK